MSLIMLDPGHGGNDPGAVGRVLALRESFVNLDVCNRLGSLLNQMKHGVRFTRSDDTSITVQRRAQLANEHNVDWFISVHCNSHTGTVANGTETFHFPGSKNGERLAILVQRRLVEELQRVNRGVKTGNFAVLQGTRMPAILIELAFLSNPEEERLLNNVNFRQAAANAIANAVMVL